MMRQTEIFAEPIGRWLPGIVVSNPVGSVDVCLLSMLW